MASLASATKRKLDEERSSDDPAQLPSSTKRRQTGSQNSSTPLPSGSASMPRSKQCPKSPYRYEPLAKDGSHVRLMTLLPGEPASELRMLLSNVTFDTRPPPFYEAMSYAWGSTETPAFVTVGESGSTTVAVTQNLAIALPYLRYQHRPRILWIDAICVNQMDLAERSQQVGLLGGIFKSAARVIAWVGPEADDSSLALKTFETIGTNVEVDWHRYKSKPASRSEESLLWGNLTISQPSPLGERQMNAIKAFLCRPYFERLWIRQEIQLAESSATIFCGVTQMSWKQFRTSVFVITWELEYSSMRWSTSERTLYRDRVNLVRKLCTPYADLPYENRIYEAEQSVCSDPRDRIYALLSIHGQRPHAGRHRLTIRPDYDAPISRVYQQATVELICQTQLITILASCELQDGNPHNLPSWVPDLSRPRQSRPLESAKAAGAGFPDCEILAGEILRVRGRIWCTLQTIKSFHMGEREFMASLQRLKQMRPQVGLETSYIAGGTLLDAYCDALISGNFSDSQVPPHSFNEREECKKLLEMIWDAKANWDDLEDLLGGLGGLGTLSFLGAAFKMCRNRTLCTTEQGYIALAPGKALPGDQVCVLLGCESCMLLRPTGSRWQVVGECYVPGLASGQALAGSLPENYKVVLCYDEARTGWYRKIYDTLTNQVIGEDPRFDVSEYPEVGSTIETTVWNPSKQASERFEVQIASEDSRLRLAYPWREENLEKRGVVLQDFYLV